MTATRIIEDDRGTCSRRLHPHNGYYAGHFEAERAGLLAPATVDPVIRIPRHTDREVLA